jgi:hypothetical protein
MKVNDFTMRREDGLHAYHFLPDLEHVGQIWEDWWSDGKLVV